MASGRPSNASPGAWYAMARVVDQNQAANEAFTSTFQTPPLRLLSYGMFFIYLFFHLFIFPFFHY